MPNLEHLGHLKRRSFSFIYVQLDSFATRSHTQLSLPLANEFGHRAAVFTFVAQLVQLAKGPVSKLSLLQVGKFGHSAAYKAFCAGG